MGHHKIAEVLPPTTWYEKPPVLNEDKREILQDQDDGDNLTIAASFVCQILEHNARQRKNEAAVICGDSTLTFGEVNDTANRIARILQERGIQHGDIVGVALERSANIITILTAVWKSGAAYVPIDPHLPTERVRHMVEDACPKMVITSNCAFLASTYWEPVSVQLDTLLSMASSTGVDSSNLDVPLRPEDLAYIMYTSGSTGRPKGVEIRHGGVSNLLHSLRNEPGCDETDRLLAVTTISFDMALVELFLPMTCKATVVIAQSHEIRDPAALIKLMQSHGITIMQATPASWGMLLESGWQGQPRLRKIFCGGEALSRRLADRLLACTDMMWNMYGPTEATVYASIWKVCSGQDIIIGRPVDNCYLYVLDEKLSPVAMGQPGELYIGGAGVARGYRNRADLSYSAFISGHANGEFVYRTGDLACFLPSGQVKLMGRIDRQVKIRGYRIELGDIESATVEHKDISEAIAICREDRLIMYYLRKPLEVGPHALSGSAFERSLRLWLAGRLPSYMVPAFLVKLEVVPVTLNGKIDHKALPDPLEAPLMDIVTKSTTDLERHLLLIWSKILANGHIDTTDNFFEVGGDSMRLVRVQSELQELLGKSIPITTLFEHFTIKTLAEHLTHSQKTSTPNSSYQQAPRDKDEDIAIISMSCRLPGGIETPEEFWELLESGADAITDVPQGRWDDATMEAQGNARYRGGFVSSLGSFDLSFFGISPREAGSLDPAQYMMLETCWEGFERAGYTRKQLCGSQTGVFIGTSNILAHLGLNSNAAKSLADIKGYTTTGSAGGTLSGRISHQLDLWGPTMTIDTACSSSLVATHLACNALRYGECDMAVSGGISLILNPGLHVEFGQLGGMSSDGRCRSFDADAQGTGWAEGCAVVILKRLSDAQRDKDTIHGVIKSTATNHDGRSATLTIPSGIAQQRLVQGALTAAGLRPEDIDYVEAHGTATKLGDPIEATALGEVFGASSSARREPLSIGSVKSNIGHTQAAAGLAGLLKTVLSIRHSTLPQTLHVVKPTPAVDWKEYNMTPSLSKRSWPSEESRPRRAGVSAFGIGGSNAHIIIEEAPKQLDNIRNVDGLNPKMPSMPYLLSGDTDAALRAQAERLNHSLNDGGLKISRIHDIAYSLATSRDQHRKRLVLIASGKDELSEKLNSVAHGKYLTGTALERSAEAPKIAAMFSGQGSQWPGMGKDLYDTYPAFRKALGTVTSEFAVLDMPLLQIMWAEPGSTNGNLLGRTDFAQACLFALEVALWRLWQSWGIQPEFVIGHSLGEIVAAHVAGVLNLPDACRLVVARGKLMQAQRGDYMMASLEAGPFEVSSAVEQVDCVDSIDVAAYNTPTQTVVSGTSGAVKKVTSYFAALGRKSNIMTSEYAFHSRYIARMLEEFRDVAETLHFCPSRMKIVSGMDGKLAIPEQLEQADYWVRQVRKPVRFREGIEELAHQGANIFLELGPRSVLCGLGAACLANRPESASIAWLPAIRAHSDGVTDLQRSLAELHVRHITIDWTAYFEPFSCRRVELPTYAFQRDFTLQFGTLSPNSVTRKGGLANQTRAPSRSGKSHSFEIGWEPVNTPDTHSQKMWGLLSSFGGESPWTDNLISTLQRAGDSLVNINLDDLGTIHDIHGLVCPWDTQTETIFQSQEVIVKALAQLQKAVRLQIKVPLIWITRGAIGTGVDSGDQNIQPQAAPVWGLMRTAQREHSELQLRLIDVDERASSLCASALRLDSESECAVRKNQISVPRLRAISPAFASLQDRELIRKDGAVIITGGLGYIGSQTARWLATKHSVRDLVLVSRRGLDTQGANDLVTELSGLGAEVTVLGCDVANPEDVKTIMAIFGENRRLRGVIHAAGTSDPGVLSAMTPERCVKTLAPKVSGAWLLHQAVQNTELDFFVMFSSISGILGMPGLATYSAANTFMDSLAYLRRAQGLPATSVAYGTWTGDGMAARLSQNTHSHLARFGLDPLTPDQGFALLEEAVRSSRSLTVAAALDPDRLRAYFEEQSGIPPLLRTFLGTTKGPNAQEPIHDLRSALMDAETSLHQGIVLDMTQGVVAKMLGFSCPRDLDLDRPLQEVGIDSLTAVQVRNSLTTLTGLKLSANMVMLHPTIRTLGKALLSQLTVQLTAQKSSNIANTSDLILNTAHEGILDSSLMFDNVSRDRKESVAPSKAIFLTGGTGFVGTFVLCELLRLGIMTYCLVRATSIEQARERVVRALQSYGFWSPDFAVLIKPLVGDMSQDLLGLPENIFDKLAFDVDAICHCGGLVDWMRPMEDYIGPNIVSTHEILRLASRGRAKSVHLVSTISTLPKHMGLTLAEGDREYGYGTSKYIAERLVAAARWRGANATIYRLPYVAASATSGHFRRDRGDFLHNFVSGCLMMGAFPSLDADMSMVLPVDYLSSTIATVMTQDLIRQGQDIDFLSSRAPTCNEFFRLAAAVSGDGRQQILPFVDWKQKALDFAIAHPTSPLARIAAVLDSYIDETAADMFKGMPVGRNVLGGDNYPAPPLDEAFLAKYLKRIGNQDLR